MTWTIMPTSFPGFSPTRASCLCPKVLHNHFFSISPGYYSRPKRNLRRWLRKIFGSKQGFIMVYEKMMNMGTCKLVPRFSLLGTRLGHDVNGTAYLQAGRKSHDSELVTLAPGTTLIWKWNGLNFRWTIHLTYTVCFSDNFDGFWKWIIHQSSVKTANIEASVLSGCPL